MALTDSPLDTTGTAAATADDDEALRKRLLSRIAVAGVVILGLLGGLAVFDSLNRPPAPAMPRMAATPAEPAVRVEEEKPAEAPAAEPEQRKEAVPAEPERTETPLAPLPADKPVKLAKPVTPPASAHAASVKPLPPAAAAARPDARQEIVKVIPESTGGPAHATPTRPLAQVADAARRFLVQVGVFSNHANAEELVTRLQQAGIPAQIESRVQVGPFASRAEADAARAKLKTLGIDDGLLVRR